MPDLLDDHPIPLPEQLVEAQRELHLRRSVYPRQVSRGAMTQAAADRQIRVQQAIVRTLQRLVG
jgi:hypothetical protein